MDKKISELASAASIDGADVSILVHNNTDYQYSFATLLSYLSSNLSTGANISFGATLPQNTTGKNGDVFVNTTSGAFAQKIAGTWNVVYTIPSGSTTDGTVLYGLGAPASSTGNNNDTYVNTTTGIFYKKVVGAWSQVFTMLNGPTGAKGDKGDKGDTGTAGHTILQGTSNPSNSTDGTNGDFYINTSTYTLFGPKTAGVWGGGTTIIGPQGEKGNTGDVGPQGAKGDTGEGVPIGGTSGQVLKKASNTDFDMAWHNLDVPAATESVVGSVELATIAEALARTDDERAMTALKTISLILDEKKNVYYQIAPVSLNEVSFLMRVAGNVTGISISGASNAKLKIGTTGTYPVGTQTFPFTYAAGNRVFATFNYTDLTNATCNIILTCRDN